MADATCLTNVREEIVMFLANLEVYGSMHVDLSDSSDAFVTDLPKARMMSLLQVTKLLTDLSSIESIPIIET